MVAFEFLVFGDETIISIMQRDICTYFPTDDLKILHCNWIYGIVPRPVKEHIQIDARNVRCHAKFERVCGRIWDAVWTRQCFCNYGRVTYRCIWRSLIRHPFAFAKFCYRESEFFHIAIHWYATVPVNANKNFVSVQIWLVQFHWSLKIQSWPISQQRICKLVYSLPANVNSSSRVLYKKVWVAWGIRAFDGSIIWFDSGIVCFFLFFMGFFLLFLAGFIAIIVMEGLMISNWEWDWEIYGGKCPCDLATHSQQRQSTVLPLWAQKNGIRTILVKGI